MEGFIARGQELVAALAQPGIQTTSFIAVIGAAGLAVGLALQGSLANLAAGVLMLIFRPFKLGDYIAGAGVEGIVEEIHIFSTQLATFDNKAIIIPNAKLTGDNITNYTRKENRRVDLVFAVGYGEDIEKVKRAIGAELAGDARVLKDPPATVAVQGIRGPVPQLEACVRQA
jgi:small conductance mechanosensitive channel